jgi:hypothetical protein
VVVELLLVGLALTTLGIVTAAIVQLLRAEPTNPVELTETPKPMSSEPRAGRST